MVRRNDFALRAVFLVTSDGTLFEEFLHTRTFMVNCIPLLWLEYHGWGGRAPFLTAEALGRHTLRPMTLAFKSGLRFPRR